MKFLIKLYMRLLTRQGSQYCITPILNGKNKGFYKVSKKTIFGFLPIEICPTFRSAYYFIRHDYRYNKWIGQQLAVMLEVFTITQNIKTDLYQFNKYSINTKP